MRSVSSYAFEHLLEGHFVSRSGAITTQSVVARFEYFSESIGGKCGSDELDMWLKIAQQSNVRCIHEVLSFRCEWPEQDSRPLRAAESIVRLWVSWKR
jgi:hypothetical protein